MGPVPLRADEEIIKALQERRLSNDDFNDFEMHRYLRDAQKIASGTPERDIAIAFVLSYWRKFDEAEKAVDNLLYKWGRSKEVMHIAVVCYAAICCYEKCVAKAKELFSLDPSDVSKMNLYEHALMISGSISEHEGLLEKMHLSGVSSMNSLLGKNIEEKQYLEEKGISDDEVVSYFQRYIDVAKPFFGVNPNLHIGTNIAINEDHETGVKELWISIVANIDGLTASKIDWEFSKQDFDGFSADLKSSVFVGLELAPRQALQQMRMP